jgi:hypothetical protein
MVTVMVWPGVRPITVQPNSPYGNDTPDGLPDGNDGSVSEIAVIDENPPASVLNETWAPVAEITVRAEGTISFTVTVIVSKSDNDGVPSSVTRMVIG